MIPFGAEHPWVRLGTLCTVPGVALSGRAGGLAELDPQCTFSGGVLELNPSSHCVLNRGIT